MIKYEIIQSLSNEDYIVSESMLLYIDSLLQLNEKASMYQENYEGDIDSINISHLFLEADSSNNKNKNFIEKIWNAIKEAWEAIINFLTGNSNKDKDTQKKLNEAKNANPNAVKDMKSKLSSTSGESSNEVKTSPDGKKYIPLVGVSLAGVLGAGYGISLKLKNKKNTTEPDNQLTNQPEIETNEEKVEEEETVVAVITHNDGSEITKEELDEKLKEERDRIKQILIEIINVNDGVVNEITDDFNISMYSFFNYEKINEILAAIIKNYKQLVEQLKNTTDVSSLTETFKTLSPEIENLQKQLKVHLEDDDWHNYIIYDTFKEYSDLKDKYIKLLREYADVSGSLGKEWVNYLTQQNVTLSGNITSSTGQNSNDIQIPVTLSNGTTTIMSLSEYRKASDNTIGTLRGEINRLTAELNAAELSNDQIKEEYKQKLDDLERQKNELQNNLDDLKNKNSILGGKAVEGLKANTALEAELNKLKQQNARLSNDNKSLQSTNVNLYNTIKEMEKKIKDLEEQQRSIQASAQTLSIFENTVSTSASEIVNRLQSPGEKLTPINGSPYKQNTSSTPTTSATKYDNTAIFNAISEGKFVYVKLWQAFDHSVFNLEANDIPQIGYNWMTADNIENANVVRIYPLLELNDDNEIGNIGSHLIHSYHEYVFTSKTTSYMRGQIFIKINKETLKPAIFIREGDNYKLDKMGNFDVLE